jgi:hypothetical protein
VLLPQTKEAVLGVAPILDGFLEHYFDLLSPAIYLTLKTLSIIQVLALPR